MKSALGYLDVVGMYCTILVLKIEFHYSHILPNHKRIAMYFQLNNWRVNVSFFALKNDHVINYIIIYYWFESFCYFSSNVNGTTKLLQANRSPTLFEIMWSDSGIYKLLYGNCKLHRFLCIVSFNRQPTTISQSILSIWNFVLK